MAKRVIDRQGRENDELLQAVEAADRASAIVTDHVRSIIDAAESRAEPTRRQAHASATRLLERIDAIEGQLGNLARTLRREADQLAADLNRRG